MCSYDSCLPFALPKHVCASSCSCQGRSGKVCDVHASKLTEHLRLLCLGKQDVSGFALATCYEYKKSPAKRVSLPRTNKQIIYPRCHLDSQHTLRRLAGYQHIPGNSRIPTRCRILRKNPFPCTLSGPFDNLFLTRFSASRVLCKGIVAVISTSTVYNIQLLRTDFTRKYKSCQAKKSYEYFSNILFQQCSIWENVLSAFFII